MATIRDLNLLHALDALLQEASVTKAAARAHLTTPAMSRALGRLRDALGDPLLVRAGRNLVMTPLAVALKERTHTVAVEANALLGPHQNAELTTVTHTLVVRCTDAIAAVLLAPLAAAAATEAPGLRFRFVPEGDEDAAPLRDGRLDLDVGVLDFAEPELRTRLLLRDTYRGICRRGHALSRGRVTMRRYAAATHIVVSRRGKLTGPIDAELAKRGHARRVTAVVPDFLTALHAVATSDLVAAIPAQLARHAARALDLAAFSLPMATPPITCAMAWHPRLDADPAHRWLRHTVERVFMRSSTRVDVLSAPRRQK